MQADPSSSDRKLARGSLKGRDVDTRVIVAAAPFGLQILAVLL
jgi:hypothetical protein